MPCHASHAWPWLVLSWRGQASERARMCGQILKIESKSCPSYFSITRGFPQKGCWATRGAWAGTWTRAPPPDAQRYGHGAQQCFGQHCGADKSTLAAFGRFIDASACQTFSIVFCLWRVVVCGQNVGAFDGFKEANKKTQIPDPLQSVIDSHGRSFRSSGGGGGCSPAS